MAGSLGSVAAIAHLGRRDRRERADAAARAGLPEGRVGDVKAVVRVQRQRDGRDAGRAFADQPGQAQHVRMRAGDRQRRSKRLPGQRVERAPVGGQVAKVVLRVDEEKLDVFLHEAAGWHGGCSLKVVELGCTEQPLHGLHNTTLFELIQQERKKMMATRDIQEMERPLTTVDVVIFTVLDGQLQVLLVRRPDGPDEPFPNAWALPGGFVDVRQDDSLEGCARRKLLDKTGVSSPYLEQLGSWGGKSRDPRGWSATHAYFALLPADSVQLKQEEGKAAQWHPVNELPPGQPLAFDHAGILQAALERLRSKVEYTSLPAFLLPEPFTLPQLQKVYEIVLGRPVDKSGFRTRALAAGFLDEQAASWMWLAPAGDGLPPEGQGAAVYFPRPFSPRSN